MAGNLDVFEWFGFDEGVEFYSGTLSGIQDLTPDEMKNLEVFATVEVIE